MRRREFTAGLSGAAAWSSVVVAQNQPLPVVSLGAFRLAPSRRRKEQMCCR
jgi:hypothetical protein